MVEIQWEKLAKNPQAAEALITMLILRLRPRAQEVDGVGGDEGRDVYEYTESNTLEIVEIKSFTGRMRSSQRDQVERSLVSAARHQPDAWDLVVPISPNPSELRWFGGLRTRFPFVRDWRGLKWLNMQLAAHDDLVRYALHEAADYILERIAEARAERDTLLGGVPDLLARYEALRRRAQEISPHYTLVPLTGPDGSPAVSVRAKSASSTEQAPITINTQLHFRSDDPQDAERLKRLEQTMHFGGDIELHPENLGLFTVDAPPALGIGSSFTPTSMRISSPREVVDPPIRASLALMQPSGIPLASMPLQFTERVTGTAGGTLFGSDSGGLLTTRLRFNARERSWQLNWTLDPEAETLPGAALPGLRLMSSLGPGSDLQLTLRAEGPTSRLWTSLPRGWQNPGVAQTREAIEDLAALQERTGQVFPIPRDFTLRDAWDVKGILALLRGESVPTNASTVAWDVTTLDELDRLSRINDTRIAASCGSLTFTLGDWDIELGPCIEYFTVHKVLNQDEAADILASGRPAKVRMQLTPGAPSWRVLGTELEAPGAAPAS
ncbi:hypothetical protein [Streptomyces sp. NPDC002133]|uniref:hypothetical protein n=1 Tax=Streptomyces sp. NPDC002133 TaxID=3154409 RepID=UPI00332C2CEE